jgi:hypothetical protein
LGGALANALISRALILGAAVTYVDVPAREVPGPIKEDAQAVSHVKSVALK